MASNRKTHANPFEYARELGAGELVDRDDELEAVVNTIRNHGKLFLICPRRYGKTSILKAASERAARKGMVVLRYNVEAWPSLGEMPRAQFLAFINAAFKKTSILIKARASETILALAEEVPYNVQRLAHASWEYLTKTGKSTISEAHVRAALALILRRDDPFYTQIWNPLSPQQKKALIAVIRMSGINLLSKASLEIVGLPNSTMQQATKALKDKEILRDEEKPGQKVTRFEDPFFAAWIVMVTS